MAHHRKAHPGRSWRGCAMCKPHKRKGWHDERPSVRRRLMTAQAQTAA